jgi:hypothetical protein
MLFSGTILYRAASIILLLVISSHFADKEFEALHLFPSYAGAPPIKFSTFKNGGTSITLLLFRSGFF